MKYRLFLWLFLLGALASCEDDDKIGFDVPVEFRKVSFEAVPGGAMMRYRLPDNMDIFGVRARYNDAYGRQLVKEATYLTNTLLLNGFTEAKTNVPVSLTFFNEKLEESAPFEMTFDTQDAATVALFDNLTVNPFWGGFNVTYTSPKTVEGTVHIFYVGINPYTQREDNILVGSFPILEGGDTLNFELKQALDELNVVVRTDDFEGNTVKTQIYKGIEAMGMKQLQPDEFKFIYAKDLEIEDEPHQIGKKYLFDGQKKGANYRANYKNGNRFIYGTWIAGPSVFGERFIIDFGTPKIPAMLRGDVFLYHGYEYPTGNNPYDEKDNFVIQVFGGSYTSRLPNKIKVYGTNAADPQTVSLEECTKLFELDDDPLWPNLYNKAWCRHSDNPRNSIPAQDAFRNKEDSDFNMAEPISLDMKCNYLNEAFRYVFFVVEHTYYSNRWNRDDYNDNPKEYITFDELEVFVKLEQENKNN